MSPLEATSKLVAQASLADFTQTSLIVPRLGAVDVPGVIAELSQLLQKQGCVSDVLALYHAALNKELMESTAQSCGIAFPHGRLSGIKRLRFAMGVAPQPIVWGDNPSCHVQIVFLLAVPATDAAAYLHLLASLARLGQRPDVLNHILCASGTAEIMSMLGMLPMWR